MRRQVVRFDLLSFLSFVLLVPGGIGFVSACYGTATYIELIILADPFDAGRQTVAAWMTKSDGDLRRFLSLCALVVFNNAWNWALAALAIAVLSFNRHRILRIFALSVVTSMPVVTLIFAAPLSDYSWIHLIAIFTCAGLALTLSTSLFIAICKIRPIRTEAIQIVSGRRVLLQRFFVVAVIALSLVFSAFGWRILADFV